jgi:hypothetical protein
VAEGVVVLVNFVVTPAKNLWPQRENAT